MKLYELKIMQDYFKLAEFAIDRAGSLMPCNGGRCRECPMFPEDRSKECEYVSLSLGLACAMDMLEDKMEEVANKDGKI